MQPIDRDTQIDLMKNAEERLSARVGDFLRAPVVRAAALKCAFDRDEPEFTSKQVRIARRA